MVAISLWLSLRLRIEVSDCEHGSASHFAQPKLRQAAPVARR